MNDNRKRRPLTAKRGKVLTSSEKMPQSRQKNITKKKQSRIRKLKNPPIQKKDSRKRLLKVKFRRLLLSRKKNRPHKDLPRI